MFRAAVGYRCRHPPVMCGFSMPPQSSSASMTPSLTRWASTKVGARGGIPYHGRLFAIGAILGACATRQTRYACPYQPEPLSSCVCSRNHRRLLHGEHEFALELYIWRPTSRHGLPAVAVDGPCCPTYASFFVTCLTLHPTSQAATGLLVEDPAHAAQLVAFGKAIIHAAATVYNPRTGGGVQVRQSGGVGVWQGGRAGARTGVWIIRLLATCRAQRCDFMAHKRLVETARRAPVCRPRRLTPSADPSGSAQRPRDERHCGPAPGAILSFRRHRLVQPTVALQAAVQACSSDGRLGSPRYHTGNLATSF